MEEKKNGIYLVTFKETNTQKHNIQYECLYENYSYGKQIQKNIKHFINLFPTDSGIYLFGYFAAMLTSFKINSKEIVLSKINKVILIDIKKQYESLVVEMFKNDKDVIKFNKNYMSSNGSSMTLMVLDLTKIYKKEK